MAEFILVEHNAIKRGKHWDLRFEIPNSKNWASFSMNEAEFTEMVKAVREAEKAIGVVNYSLTEKQLKGRDFSRSLYFVEDIKAGEVITENNVRSIRPGFGLHPKYFGEIIGEISNVKVAAGNRFSLDLIRNEK